MINIDIHPSVVAEKFCKILSLTLSTSRKSAFEQWTATSATVSTDVVHIIFIILLVLGSEEISSPPSLGP